MSINGFVPDKALEQLEKRERCTTESRIVAARFCLAVAMRSGIDGLLADVLNHFELTPTGESMAEREGRSRRFGFWLHGAQELRLPGAVISPPQGAAITVRTDEFARGDSDRFSMALHTQPGGAAMRVELRLFNEQPQWWLDLGKTQSDVGERFTVEGEEGTEQYMAGQANSATKLEMTSRAILASLATATWEETVNIGGDLL